MTPRALFVIAAIVVAGLMAGLLFGWLVSVIPGTSRVDDRTYVQTMQRINVAIINPAFVIPFMLTPLFLAGAAMLEYRVGNQRRGTALGAGAAVYVLGVLGVTVGGNVPLNNALDVFDLAGATEKSLAVRRHSYEGPWNRWHGLRTAASIIAFALATSALLIVEAE
ncbi:MAG: DUF1772 domain-containing protein [Acidimicrobiales bacterium]